MFNVIMVLALIVLFIWNLVQNQQLKRRHESIEEVKYNAKAFEIQMFCIAYFNEHGLWPDIDTLRQDRGADSLDCSLWADWKIEARFEPIYTKQWLLEVSLPKLNVRYVRRIFHTGIRQAA